MSAEAGEQRMEKLRKKDRELTGSNLVLEEEQRNIAQEEQSRIDEEQPQIDKLREGLDADVPDAELFEVDKVATNKEETRAGKDALKLLQAKPEGQRTIFKYSHKAKRLVDRLLGRDDTRWTPDQPKPEEIQAEKRRKLSDVVEEKRAAK